MNLQQKEHFASERKECGFVLPTSLMLLTLLSILATTMYYVSRSSMLISSSAQASTAASYYAETAIHYISWALSNDAEFDNFPVSGTYVAPPFGEPPVPSNADVTGDKFELNSYLWTPGPTGSAVPPGPPKTDTGNSTDTAGQIMYFDNSPLAGRHLCMENEAFFSNCVDITLKEADRTEPSMYQVSTKLPRYIKLDISSGDSSKSPAIPPSITASIPSLPHRNPPEVEHDQLTTGTYDHNGDIPKNGAIVWLTAVDFDNNNHDLEIFPLDPAQVYSSGVKPKDCHKSLPYDQPPTNGCPCLKAGGQLNTGSVAANNGIHWEASSQSGNDIIIKYEAIGANTTLQVSTGTSGTSQLSSKHLNAVIILISLATDSMGASISTAGEVINEVNTIYLPSLPSPPAELQNLSVASLKLRDGSATVSNDTGIVSSNGEGEVLVHFDRAQACNANTGGWLSKYNIAAYAIGYVNGKPSHMLRAVIK